MVISYEGLWNLMKQRQMSRQDLINLAGISYSTIRSMEKGNNVNLDMLRKICEAMCFKLGDIAVFVEE